VATITTATDIENGCTAQSNAKPLPKYDASMPSHPCPITGWTSRPLS
jgi:hypothetical protein